MKILFLIVNPLDRPSFDDGFLWDQLTGALGSSAARQCIYDRLLVPTEAALCQALSQNDWDILHVITHTQEPETAAYGTVALLSADKRSRSLSAKHFASLVSGFLALRLIVLQTIGDHTPPLTTAAQALIANGVPAAICAPAFRGRSEQLFVATLYSGLLSGCSLNDLAKQLAAIGKTAGDGVFSQLCFHGKDMNTPVLAPTRFVPIQPVENPADTRTNIALPPNPPAIDSATEPWRRELQRKRESGIFDVFLSHNSEDKPQVKQLGIELMQAGILPWLDVWELQPGQLWQRVLYEQIQNIRSAAVCIGASGIHGWQEHEINALFIEFVDRKAPVIPVLLPNAPSNPQLPNFLRTLNWVDFRTNDPPPLEQLIWGITGRRPDN